MNQRGKKSPLVTERAFQQVAGHWEKEYDEQVTSLVGIIAKKSLIF